MSLPRLLGQVVWIGAGIFAKSFTAAWRQAAANIRAGEGIGGAAGASSAGANARDPISRKLRLTLDESMLIMNVDKELLGKGDREAILAEAVKRYERMMEANANSSFYIQSKIARARERIVAEFGELGPSQSQAQQQRQQQPPPPPPSQ